MQHNYKIRITFLTLLILLVGLYFNFRYYQQQKQLSISVEAPLVTYQPEDTAERSLQQIIHDLQKNVMQISVETPDSSRVGSGFLYNNKGDIVTNAHVIEDATSIKVTLTNAEPYPAAIVGIGETDDIAVIRVPQLINQRPIAFDASTRFDIGSDIIAVGSPLGLQNSVSVGIISGVNRTFDIGDFLYENVYQISSNITHGNSGGPLIDRGSGMVIGINSAGITDSDIGFSIPLVDVIDQLTEWSMTSNYQDLTLPSGYQPLASSINDYEEDSYYLVQYFIDNLAVYDYINAYTLLGANLQEQTSYADFRNQYSALKSLRIVKKKDTIIQDEQISFQIDIEKETKDETSTTMVYTFSVALENDQLKIIDYYINEN